MEFSIQTLMDDQYVADQNRLLIYDYFMLHMVNPAIFVQVCVGKMHLLWTLKWIYMWFLKLWFVFIVCWMLLPLLFVVSTGTSTLSVLMTDSSGLRYNFHFTTRYCQINNLVCFPNNKNIKPNILDLGDLTTTSKSHKKCKLFSYCKSTKTRGSLWKMNA